jgi:hypothetical protein
MTMMKLFKDDADIADIDKAIETMKEVERLLTSIIVRGDDWMKAVPVRASTADRLNAHKNRILKMRMDMQEDGFQVRRARRLPPPPDGYS